jgi:hypothetical protein
VWCDRIVHTFFPVKNFPVPKETAIFGRKCKKINGMDNHVGDWLYYIVILVVGIISFISNQNKKKSQAQTLPPEPSSSMEEVLPPAPQVQPRRRTNPPSAPKPRRTSYASPSPGTEEGQRMLDEEAIAFGEKMETKWADELNLTDADVFRKAFISAEILNRKY